MKHFKPTLCQILLIDLIYYLVFPRIYFYILKRDFSLTYRMGRGGGGIQLEFLW